MEASFGSRLLSSGLTLSLVLLLLVMTPSLSLSTDVTSTISAPPEPSPPSRPETGFYNVTKNGTACLMARMGLQLNVTYLSRTQSKAVQEIINLQPNVTKASGFCSEDNATLILREEKTTLTFSFLLNETTNKYHLGRLELSANLSDMTQPLSVSNGSLNYLRGTLGFSYECHNEQILNVGQNFSLNTFQLRVQPFGVRGNEFGEAELCELDKRYLMIPIAVGAALAGLVLVVLVAYLIGRKRSRAGYQTI